MKLAVRYEATVLVARNDQRMDMTHEQTVAAMATHPPTHPPSPAAARTAPCTPPRWTGGRYWRECARGFSSLVATDLPFARCWVPDELDPSSIWPTKRQYVQVDGGEGLQCLV